MPQTNAATQAAPDAGPIKLNANAPDSAVGFDPGNTYKPPHTVVASADAKKLTDVRALPDLGQQRLRNRHAG